MKFAIISHAEHMPDKGRIFSYAPYVKEMNLWLKNIEQVKIVAPVVIKQPDEITIAYNHLNLRVEKISAISLLSIKEIFNAFLQLPFIFFKIYKAMKWADHIHLRCPGNIGLIGCIVQILFPKKPKTVKYAGNWDPIAQQPLSYKLQKWILSNEFLSKNMTVLVYGEWKNQSRNIKPFFTASFTMEEVMNKPVKSFSAPYRCMFVGSLVPGKRPMFAIQLVECLRKKGVEISLEMYGDGVMRAEIENYIERENISDFIKLQGNKPLEVVKEAYKKSHFLILASKSEGWPKAVAEAMFWGAIPIATPISCVPWMLDNGKRGILIDPEVEEAAKAFEEFIQEEGKIKAMSEEAMKWSRTYTLGFFETEIAKLLKQQKTK